MHSMLRGAAVDLMFSTTVLRQEGGRNRMHLPAVAIGRCQSTPFSTGRDVKHFQS